MVSHMNPLYVVRKITDKQKNLDKFIVQNKDQPMLLYLLHYAPFVWKSLSVLTNAATSALGSAASQSSLLRSAGTALKMLFKRFSLVYIAAPFPLCPSNSCKQMTQATLSAIFHMNTLIWQLPSTM